jgi:hypothetical protein
MPPTLSSAPKVGAGELSLECYMRWNLQLPPRATRRSHPCTQAEAPHGHSQPLHGQMPTARDGWLGRLNFAPANQGELNELQDPTHNHCNSACVLGPLAPGFATATSSDEDAAMDAALEEFFVLGGGSSSSEDEDDYQPCCKVGSCATAAHRGVAAKRLQHAIFAPASHARRLVLG